MTLLSKLFHRQILLCLLPVSVLIGCNEKDLPTAKKTEEVVVAKDLEGAVTPSDSISISNTDKVKPVAANEFDLSLAPEDLGGSDEVFSGESQQENQWDQLFKPEEKAEDRIKFKSKLRVKEGADIDSVRQDYRGAVDGAEFGVEYKTR